MKLSFISCLSHSPTWDECKLELFGQMNRWNSSTTLQWLTQQHSL